MVNWYNIFNEVDFLAKGLPSISVDVVLDGGPGLKTILITKGVLTGMLYEGVFLTVGLNGKNPFPFEGHAIYKDPNNDVWLGIEVEDT